MQIEQLSIFTFADTTVRFLHDRTSGCVGMELFPTAMADQLVPRRATVLDDPGMDALPGIGPFPAWEVDPLVHVKIVGDSYPGAFAQGHTMRNAPSNAAFRFAAQNVEHHDIRTTIVTTLQSSAGHRIEHRFAWDMGYAAAQVTTTFINDSPYPVTLELLSSFALGGITPFHRADAPEQLQIHRFRSVWSAEGRLETRSIEELHLEPSWGGAGAYSERFGQIGSMPVRRWFPFVAVEDTQANVLWGAQLAWAGSWQMEIFRQHDPVCISGGLADREFGHWMKTLAVGESLTMPPATIACVQGDLDDLCDRLTAVQQQAADMQPAIEHTLPIIFNEWCTTWGDPSHERVISLVQRLSGSPVTYFVIDAGWYKGEGGNWFRTHGDWIPSRNQFPGGLAATAAAIRKQGLVPGLWFEIETVGDCSTAFSLVDHMLKRDGIPVTVRNRRFWDLNDPFAVAYLEEHVIKLLEQCGFGYLKVDYNETIGLGCEGTESLGEGLRRQILGTYRLFERIRERLPDLVVENCASGGHRLEPSMLARTAMSSFSDAHEVVEIPIIAANLHRLMLPRQSQIWAVLKASDSSRRLIYSLAAAFLGRMCLSGELDRLDSTQWNLVQHAEALYGQAAPIIKHGTSRRFGHTNQSWRHPTGWQAVVRTADDRSQALIVLHTFANAPTQVAIPLPQGEWKMTAELREHAQELHYEAEIVGEQLTCSVDGNFSGRVMLLAQGSGR